MPDKQKTSPPALPQPELQSKRMLLRPFVTQDAQDLFPLINDREIASNTRSIPYPYPEDGAVKWISSLAAEWNSGESAVFAACIRETDSSPVLVGAIGLKMDTEHEHAELGYWIGREFWHQGYASEGSKLVVDFGFQHLQLQRIHAHHLTRNPASGRVLEKIGMKSEGLLRKHIKKWGVFEDIVLFGILKDEWDK